MILLSTGDRKFFEFSREKWKNIQIDNFKGIVLVDSMYSEQYIFEISFVTNFFKKKNKLDIKYFIFTPRNKYVLRFFYYFLRKFTRIDKLYRSFGASFGFSNVFTANTMQMAVNTNFNSKQELLQYFSSIFSSFFFIIKKFKFT